MKIGFNRNTILYGIFAICSVVLVVYGAMGLYGAGRIKSISDLERSDIRKGQYVDLTGLEVQPYYVLEDGSTVSRDIRATTVGFAMDHEYVMASLKDNVYIYTLLNGTSDGSVSGAKDTTGLVGEVVKASSKAPDTNVYGFKESDAVVTDMVIREFDLNKRKMMLIPGLFLLVMSVVMILKQKPY